MQVTRQIRNTIAALSIVLVAAALIGATVWTPGHRDPAAPAVAASVPPAPMVGVATGELDNGTPVYRLPPITVTASRSAELARMAREEQLAAK